MTRNIAHLALILGLITAVGPFAIDIYLPALPSLGTSLHASPEAVQMSLVVFFIIQGLCQLFYGPLSDIYGRKPPIYAGLLIFAIGSIGCTLAPDIETLIVFRAVQAFGACAGMVIPRAIARDLYIGHESARLMALLMLVVSISPILAPLTGSLIIEAWGWRAVFGVLAGVAMVCLVLAVTQLTETRAPEHRGESNWRSAFAAYRYLLADPVFSGLSLVGGFGIAAFSIFIGGGPFVYINHFGLTPTQFSVCFALNAASFFAFSQFTANLSARFGLARVIHGAVTGFSIVMVLLALTTTLLDGGLVLMMSLLFIGFGFLGIVVPATAVLSMEDHGRMAGAASALMGAIQMVTGAAALGVNSLFTQSSPETIAIAIALCAVSAWLVAWPTLRRVPVVPV
ncbi:TPA: multidrug effflux MFS transporter [Pseudomonas aeruginosa]